LTGVQLVECALQLLKLLSGLAEFTFGCQTLIIGKVLGRRTACFNDTLLWS
jgi:hypothetical protein